MFHLIGVNNKGLRVQVVISKFVEDTNMAVLINCREVSDKLQLDINR